MDERKETTGTKQKSTDANNDAGSKSEANSLVDRADAAAERLAKENERMEKNLREQQEFEARNRLGGRSENAPAQKKTEELSDKEYAEKVLSGEIKEE